MGYKAFGKLHRDDFLSAFSPRSMTWLCLWWAMLRNMRAIVAWDVDQQFGGRRDDDPNGRKTSISPEDIWDLYWHPVRILTTYLTYPSFSLFLSFRQPYSSSGTIGWEWQGHLLGLQLVPQFTQSGMSWGTHSFYTKIMVRIFNQQLGIPILSTAYCIPPDRRAYKAHVRDEYTILLSGRLVISLRVWRTVDVLLPNQYVSIQRPDEGAPWA